MTRAELKRGVKVTFTGKDSWEVWRLFGANQKRLEIVVDRVSLGEDTTTLEEARAAIAWYVDHLGGNVVWEKV